MPAMMPFVRSAARLAALLAIALAPAQAMAQEWPSKPIRLVVAFAAGGTADIFARLLGPELSASLKQQIVVENRPGSSGATGSAQVAAAEPDGYTLLMCGSGPHITGPVMNPNVGYDPVRDFTHLAMVAGDTYVLAVAKGLGVKSIAELKASGRTAISAGSPGAGSLGHLLIEQTKRKVGLDLVHVPYRSAGDSINDVIGNHIGAAMSPLISAAEQVRAGTMLALAVTSLERNPALPEVPSFAELGYKDVRGSGWFWLCGPKSLPAPIAARLNAETRKAVKSPAVKARFERDALISPDYEMAALGKFVAEEIALWAPLIRELGLKVQ